MSGCSDSKLGLSYRVSSLPSLAGYISSAAVVRRLDDEDVTGGLRS